MFPKASKNNHRVTSIEAISALVIHIESFEIQSPRQSYQE